MTVQAQQFQPEETYALIAERAKVLVEAGQQPVFDVVLSRRTPVGVPDAIASFSGATLEQIQDPLRWVPALCGGGEYILNVRHPSVNGRIGGPLHFKCDKSGPGMEPRPPNPLVTIKADWQGPARINAPPLPEPSAASAAAAAAASTANIMAGYGVPPAPAAVPQATVVADRERELQQQLAEMKANSARVEAESRAKAELEAVRREADARVREVQQQGEKRLAELESRLNMMVFQAQQPKADPAGGWEKLLAIIMPLVQQIMTQQSESRIAMLRMNEEQNRRQIEAAEKQHAVQMEFIKSMSAKPGMSDEMRMLIETLKAQASSNGTEAMSAMMTRTIEAMGTISKTSMAMIETTVDALGGEPDHPAVIAIREGASALKSIMAGQREAATRVVKRQQPQQALPPGQRQLTPQEVAMLRQRQAAQQAAQQRAAQAARTQPGKPSVASVSTPQAASPAPVQPQAAAPVLAQPAPAPVAAPVVVAHTNFEILKAGINAFKPPEEAARFFIDLAIANDPSLGEQLDKHGGSPYNLLLAEFGEPFVQANMGYFAELGRLIDEKGSDAGLWGDEEEAGDEGDGDGVTEVEAQAEAASAELVVPLEAPPEPNGAVPVVNF